MKKAVLAFVFFISSMHTTAQQAQEVLDGVIKNYEKVKDYQADVHIVADISFIRILPMNARIYFKQPDKMRIVSKGIAILPRQGFDLMYRSITDKNSFTVVPQGNELLEGVQVQVISLLPLSDTMEVIIAKFWIDPQRHVIMKSQITTRTNGTIAAAYSYGSFATYGLPDQMTFWVDVKKFKIPKAVAADLNNNEKKEQPKGKDPNKGKIAITLSNYIINKGVPDKIFQEK